METGIPVLAGRNEVERLHGVAKAAALQTGAQGDALDMMIADVLEILLRQSNRQEIALHRRTSLHAIK